MFFNKDIKKLKENHKKMCHNIKCLSNLFDCGEDLPVVLENTDPKLSKKKHPLNSIDSIEGDSTNFNQTLRRLKHGLTN